MKVLLLTVALVHSALGSNRAIPENANQGSIGCFTPEETRYIHQKGGWNNIGWNCSGLKSIKDGAIKVAKKVFCCSCKAEDGEDLDAEAPQERNSKCNKCGYVQYGQDGEACQNPNNVRTSWCGTRDHTSDDSVEGVKCDGTLIGANKCANGCLCCAKDCTKIYVCRCGKVLCEKAAKNACELCRVCCECLKENLGACCTACGKLTNALLCCLPTFFGGHGPHEQVLPDLCSKCMPSKKSESDDQEDPQTKEGEASAPPMESQPGALFGDYKPTKGSKVRRRRCLTQLKQLTESS